MFEFLIALFGGLFHGVRTSNAKSKIREYDERQASITSRRDTWRYQHAANAELMKWAKEYIQSGEHFDDICQTLSGDLYYVLGKDWREKLDIPNGSRVDYKSFVPVQHAYWIYHLLLANQGKIDSWFMSQGFTVSSLENKNRDIKFAQCIEGALLNAGVTDTRFVLELKFQAPEETLCNAIKPDLFCHYPSRRLWDDFIQR